MNGIFASAIAMVPVPLQWCPVGPEMTGPFASAIAMVPSACANDVKAIAMVPTGA